MRVSDNASAPYVVVSWDGKIPGIVQGWDSEAEAKADAKDRTQASPDHVEFFAVSQEKLNDKLTDLVGIQQAPIETPGRQTVNAGGKQ